MSENKQQRIKADIFIIVAFALENIDISKEFIMRYAAKSADVFDDLMTELGVEAIQNLTERTEFVDSVELNNKLLIERYVMIFGESKRLEIESIFAGLANQLMVLYNETGIK